MYMADSKTHWHGKIHRDKEKTGEISFPYLAVTLNYSLYFLLPLAFGVAAPSTAFDFRFFELVFFCGLTSTAIAFGEKLWAAPVNFWYSTTILHKISVSEANLIMETYS